MKKTTILLLALLLIASMMLASCGGNSASSESDGADAEAAAAKISEFTSVDLEGNSVSQDIFSNAEITMINFWGTYCGPCIGEMPELATLTDAYEGRAQLIGVPIDVNFEDPRSDEYKAALAILQSAGAKFTNISPDGGIAEYMKSMQFVPTSIFVDAEGNIIGEPVVGANVSEYKKVIEDYLAGSGA